MSFVVDNSVAMAWCFKDEWTDAGLALLGRVTKDGATAPQLWPLEATNGLLMAQRRKRISVDVREGMADFLRALPIIIDDETTNRVWTTTVQLAERHQLTVYDAAYLELAQRLSLPLATYDKPLRAAALSAGVALLTAD